MSDIIYSCASTDVTDVDLLFECVVLISDGLAVFHVGFSSLMYSRLWIIYMHHVMLFTNAF